ncbi:hypothetical protein AAHC03_016368 [Spirometra sp. Aus1]
MRFVKKKTEEESPLPLPPPPPVLPPSLPMAGFVALPRRQRFYPKHTIMHCLILEWGHCCFPCDHKVNALLNLPLYLSSRKIYHPFLLAPST